MAKHLNIGNTDDSKFDTNRFIPDDSKCDTNRFIRLVFAILFVILAGLLFEAIVLSQKIPEQRQQEIERMRQDTERRKARDPFEYNPGFHYFGSKVLFF